MRSSRSVVVTSAAVLLLAACTGQAATERRAEPAPMPEAVVLLDTGQGRLALSVPTGSVLFETAGAAASADGSLAFRTNDSGGATTLETIDVGTGRIASSTTIEGTWEPRVASGTGAAVALMEPLPAGWDPALPIPRSETAIIVADPRGASEPRRFELEGNFEPEAFSVDGSRLFLIQHLPAETPTAYRVTVLDLDRGRVRPVFGPFKSPPERMPGTRLQQELGPDGTRLYTLYTSSRPGYAPHGAPVGEHAAVSFVHVLDLQEGWAHCAGLPRAFWDRPASAQAMAVSSDGGLLYVVDAELGLVTVMDSETFETRTARLGIQVHDPRSTSARLGADDRTLFVATAGTDGGVYAVDTATLEVTDRWDLGSIFGLDLSSDGGRLYVALEGRVAVLDPSTGEELGAVPFASPAPVVQVSVIGA